jgi:hypothetical protein
MSGLNGDYDGAPRKALGDVAQRAVYTGYKKCYGLKVETVLLPNGISTVFGPTLARIHDVGGVLLMSGLDAFWWRYSRVSRRYTAHLVTAPITPNIFSVFNLDSNHSSLAWISPSLKRYATIGSSHANRPSSEAMGMWRIFFRFVPMRSLDASWHRQSL